MLTLGPSSKVRPARRMASASQVWSSYSVRVVGVAVASAGRMV